MFAVPLLIAALFAGMPDAEPEGGVVYITSMALYRGEMPAEGDGGCKALARPSVLTEAGRPAKVFSGGELRTESGDGSKAVEPFGSAFEVTVTPSGPGLVRVVAKVSSSEAVTDVPPGASPRVRRQGTARFAGDVPLGEPVRFGSDEVWAELRVEAVEKRQRADAR